MSYIAVEALNKAFTVRKKREKGRLLREKSTVQALKDVSFSIEQGELVGYIGPNGAGKSTTVKILSGILTPDGGSVTVGGRVPWKERKEHVRHIGVVFGQRTQLWWDVPILDSFSLLKDIYRVPREAYEKRLEALTDLLARYDTDRVMTVRLGGDLPPLPPCCQVQRDGENARITYSPEQLPTADLITLLQAAGPLREMTIQGQNVDRLIAAMYREMDL